MCDLPLVHNHLLITQGQAERAIDRVFMQLLPYKLKAAEGLVVNMLTMQSKMERTSKHEDNLVHNPDLLLWGDLRTAAAKEAA